MHTLKILKIEREEHLATGEHFISVSVEVSKQTPAAKKATVLHTRQIGFRDGTTDEEILATLEQLKNDYDARDEREKAIEVEAAKSKPHLIGRQI